MRTYLNFKYDMSMTVWHVLLMILILGSLAEMKRIDRCSAELICGERTNGVPVVIQGLPGMRGAQGPTGMIGPTGPQGLPGPPGRDGFTESPPAFYAELQHLFMTTNEDSILRPWTLSDSVNTPDASHYFSTTTGIFTAPKPGLYQFFLTIAVSQAKASASITKNGEPICTILVESLAMIDSLTTASGWSSNSIDCLIYCQMNDQISVIVGYRSNSQIYGYSYSTFSGYMLFNN